MFEGFEQRVDAGTARRFGAALLSSGTICAGLMLGALTLTAGTPPAPKEPKVDVVFRPPPPPAPVVELKPLPKPVAPPPKVVAKVAPRVAAPAAAAALEAPRKLPVVAAPEAPVETPVAAREVAVGASGDGNGKALEGGGSAAPAEVTVKPSSTGPVQLPEEAEPPEEVEGNARPEFPEAARSKGLEGLVVLKIVVERDGRVGKIAVMKGEEPFLSVAIAAVQTWKYTPAQLDGEAIAVYRVVKIPFRLKT